MSTRQTGNRYENAFAEIAEGLGYCTFAARGSRGPIDVLCFPPEGHDGEALIPIAAQIGTQGKAIRATLDDLHAAPRPIGSRCIVARYCKKPNGRRYWKFHTRAGEFAALKDALAKDAA